jgi:hypothetical protein
MPPSDSARASFALNITDGGEDVTNKPSASGSLRNPLSGSRFRRCPSVDLGSIDCR